MFSYDQCLTVDMFRKTFRIIEGTWWSAKELFLAGILEFTVQVEDVEKSEDNQKRCFKPRTGA